MPGDNAADGGQAHAGTLEFGRGVQTLEHPKQLVRVLHVEAGPVVPDQEDPLSVPGDRCEFDPGPRLFCGVFPTVAQQVLENHSQQPRVAPRFEPLGNRDFHLPLRSGPLELRRDLPCDLAQVHDLAAHFRSAETGEFQQVVDEQRHPLTGGPHPLQGISSRLVQLRAVVFQQHLAEPVDTAQGCPQVVRNRVGERVKLGIGGEQLRRVAPERFVAVLQLVGAIRDPLLELGGVASQLAVLILDASEHEVEGVGERAQFVLAELGRPHRVVLARGDRRSGFRQGEDRIRDPSL